MSISSQVQKTIRFFKRISRGLSLPLETRIFGILKNPDRTGAIVQSRVGDELQIVHVPECEMPEMVYVYSIKLNRILGFLQKSLSEDLIYIFGKGLCLDGKITEIDNNGDEQNAKYCCFIKIFSTSEMMKPYLDLLPYLHGEENYP